MPFLLITEVIECPRCSVPFGVTALFVSTRRADCKKLYCPMGHSMSYGNETEADKLKKQLANANAEVERERRLKESEQRSREAAENSLRATKGAVTKLKKRVANGVCPCCSRTFQDLSQHMANKHPNFEIEELPTVEAEKKKRGRPRKKQKEKVNVRQSNKV